MAKIGKITLVVKTNSEVYGIPENKVFLKQPVPIKVTYLRMYNIFKTA